MPLLGPDRSSQVIETMEPLKRRIGSVIENDVYMTLGLRGLVADRELVVSIETPGQAVDIWTPVAQQIGVPIEVEF
jgi:hypothetical protein